METLIIGAGAMGSLFAARLAPLTPTALLCRRATQAASIRQQGLLITDLQGTEHRIPLPVYANPAEYAQGGQNEQAGLSRGPNRQASRARQAQLILICTKAQATAAAAQAAAPLLATDGLMLSLQNGLGHEEDLAAAVGAARTLIGTTSQGATLLGPGQVRHAGAGPTYLAPNAGQEKHSAAIAALFNRAGMTTECVADRQALIWAKLLVNVAINPLAALLRLPNGALTAEPACKELMRTLLAEALAVATMLDIALPGGNELTPQLERVFAVCRQTAANHASMLQDILRGSSTEIEAINGAIVRKGRECGLATPANALISQCIRALETSASQRVLGA